MPPDCGPDTGAKGTDCGSDFAGAGEAVLCRGIAGGGGDGREFPDSGGGREAAGDADYSSEGSEQAVVHVQGCDRNVGNYYAVELPHRDSFGVFRTGAGGGKYDCVQAGGADTAGGVFDDAVHRGSGVAAG